MAYSPEQLRTGLTAQQLERITNIDPTQYQRLYRGYDGTPDVRRTNPQQNYEFWFDRPRDILSLREASIRAALEFAARYPNKEIMILYSGGLDSEWLCETFWLAKVPFTPLIVRYGDSAENEHDLAWARRWLERRGVTNAIEWNFDLRKWYGSAEQWEIAERSQLSEMAYSGQFRAMLEFQHPDRVFLNGYDEPVITADDSSGAREWNLTYNERHYAIHKFMAAYGFDTQIGGWVDANVFAAYVHCPMWQMLVANLVQPQTWNSELVKAKIYCTAFPFLEARPKYTGFESMLDVIVPETKRWRKHIEAQYGTKWLQDWSRPIKHVWNEMKDVGRGTVESDI
jgi:hypothetical protein